MTWGWPCCTGLSVVPPNGAGAWLSIHSAFLPRIEITQKHSFLGTVGLSLALPDPQGCAQSGEGEGMYMGTDNGCPLTGGLGCKFSSHFSFSQRHGSEKFALAWA